MAGLDGVSHPGTRIKAEVIPRGMSVTKAAQLLGVGRPALSNLLNGKAALSRDMAARFEKAFNVPREDLMAMQARHDAARAKKMPAPANARALVPPFLAITANDIENWASPIIARSRLAVLLRTLIHSTCDGLTKADFPGNDDAERPGWDGWIEASAGNPWVPEERSGWEFGTNQNIGNKADHDFDKSVKALDERKRADTSFVFVTPRRWRGKTQWVAEKQKARRWKDVRAYDASDLEQWIEQSLPAQAWFANETGKPADGVRSLDKSWSDWADVATPPLAGALFDTAIAAAKPIMIQRLSVPPGRPILIAADSTEEALAFLARLFGESGDEKLAAYRDRVLVFDQPGILPRLAQAGRGFLPVAHTREVECELTPHVASMHAIILYPRNVVTITPDIVLQPADYRTFNTALEKMGKNHDEIARFARESGRSLTVLRRRLANVPAIQTPSWAKDRDIAASLIPFMLTGAWHSENESDKCSLELLAECRYEDLERRRQELVQLEDAPLWSAGLLRGVVSKLDLLFAIAGTITKADLDRFFGLAGMVLGEDNPALDLPEEKRWLAPVCDKIRAFSGAFRAGIAETLVLLAVHGGELFDRRLGVDIDGLVARLVRDLLPTPLTTRILEANQRDLPIYAEAAPETFLSILECDLTTAEPAVLGLLRPVKSQAFGVSLSRSGLLWALESLAWSPATLPRAVLILARLAEVEIKDNWMNKPIHSLEAIFRSWMPQTAADAEKRMTLMKTLAQRFPDVAWKLCMAQFARLGGFGHYAYKPRWRAEGYGFGEPDSRQDQVRPFLLAMAEMALDWKEHSLATLSDLVERLPDLLDDHQARIWRLIETWANSKASDGEKASLREKIRVSVLSRRAAKAARAALEPSDVVNKHAWLFHEAWVKESADEIDDIKHADFTRRARNIEKIRRDALREVRERLGFDGILALAERGKASWEIGKLVAEGFFPESELIAFLRHAHQRFQDKNDPHHRFKALIMGALFYTAAEARARVITAIAGNAPEEDMARLLMLAPFGKTTWAMVDGLGDAARDQYWAEVIPRWIGLPDPDCIEGIGRLREAERPRAAFFYFHSQLRMSRNETDPEMLHDLLSAIAKGGKDRPGEYLLENYAVQQAFEIIDASPLLMLEQKAGLEFIYIETLFRPGVNRGRYHIPNLERYIEANPDFFARAIAWATRRKDGREDPPEFQAPPDQKKIYTERARSLLDAVQRIPGHDESGALREDRLMNWVMAVRDACDKLGRKDIGDFRIGKLLAHAPAGDDGVWPCEPVREVMEKFRSEAMASDAYETILNSRGIVMRGEDGADGAQEREIADRYRKWAEALENSHPFVASIFLRKIAEYYEKYAKHEDANAEIRRRLDE